MSTKIDRLFGGNAIELRVRGTRHSPAQAEAIRKTIAEEPPQKLRYNCVIAEAMNESLNGGPHGSHADEYGDYEIGGRIFRLNPKGRSQFGMTAHSEPYLTTSLVDTATGTRYKFTWRGEAVPRALQATAVAHDLGQDTKTITHLLCFDDAEKHVVGAKHGPRAKDRRRNHDTAKNGKPYPRRPRRHHRRICSKDLT